MKSLLILGATGLVGQQVLKAALDDLSIERVCAPTRRPLPLHDKLHNPIVDYAALPAEAGWWKADAVICALGSTMRQAGSQEAFRRIDHGYVMSAANLARSAGTEVFILNSSIGADDKARSFYLKVKGELEQDLAKLGFTSLGIVRPSLLDGGARPERRVGEEIGLWVSRYLSLLIPARYRAVSTLAVARCMLYLAMSPNAGVHVLESEQIAHVVNTRLVKL